MLPTLVSDRAKREGPPRMLRFQNPVLPSADTSMAARKKVTYMELPKKTQDNPVNALESAEKSLREFEQKFMKNPSADDIYKSLKSTYSDQFQFLSPSLERNIQRIALHKPKHKPQTSETKLTLVQTPKPPMIASRILDSNYIDKFYPHPSSSRAPNRIPLPGDFDFDIKKMLNQIKSTVFIPVKLEKQKSIPEALKLLSSDVLNNIAKTAEETEPDFMTKLLSQPDDMPISLPKQPKTNKLGIYWGSRITSGMCPESREGASLVMINRRFYLYGGQSRVKHHEVRVLNPDNWSWSLLRTSYTPKGRMGHSAIGYKHKILIFGGWTHYSKRLGVRRCVRKVYILNISDGKWQRYVGVGTIPEARRHHSTARIGKSVILFGGIDKNSRVMKDLYHYDIKQKEWSKIKAVGTKPTARSHATLVAVFDQSLLHRNDFTVFNMPKIKTESSMSFGFYLFGGLLEDGDASNDLYLLKISKEEFRWIKIEASGHPPEPRYNHTACLVSRYLIIIGGRNDKLFKTHSDSAIGDTCLFNLETRNWEKLDIQGQVPEARWGHCLASYNSKVILFGGINHYKYMSSTSLVLETDQNYVQELIKQHQELEKKHENADKMKDLIDFGAKAFRNIQLG
jgi:N-acetylneuraminic acid mutarotase